MAQLQPNGGEVTCTRTVQLHSQQVQNDCKLHLWPSQHTYNKQGNIKYCKMHQHISHWHISHSNNLKYWRAFWLLWICTNILQSCIESQDENSTLIFFYQHREYELLYSWSRTKGEDILFHTGVTMRQSKMTQQMSINYHTIRFHFHMVSIYFFFFLYCNSPEPDWKCTQWKWSSAELITFDNREMKWDSDIYDGNKQFYDWKKKRWKRKPHLEV